MIRLLIAAVLCIPAAAFAFQVDSHDGFLLLFLVVVLVVLPIALPILLIRAWRKSAKSPSHKRWLNKETEAPPSGRMGEGP